MNLNGIKKLIPDSIKHGLRPLKKRLRMFKLAVVYSEKLRKVRQKKKVKVAFLVVYESMWKYEKLYFLLKNDSRFSPIVFICPFRTYGDAIMHREMESCFSSFKEKGYEVKKALQHNGELLDIKKSFNPDLVFFCTPWKHTDKIYQIECFLDRLTAYVNYSIMTSTLYEANYNKKLHNLCWRYFVETDFHERLAKTYSSRKGKNVISLGYPGIDSFIDKTYTPKDVWKPQRKNKKRIIWAPHHTIDGNIKENNLLNYSTFLSYSEFMIELAQRYNDRVQFAFKPHPNLRGKLNQHWGKEKTDDYYRKWMEIQNTQLEEGVYVDLFLTSDAMIHDSSSFLIEYLFTKKPVLYLVNNEASTQQYNELGQKALAKIPSGYSKNDIVGFIEKIVLEGVDTYSDDRDRFVEEELMPPNDKLASENIYNYLIKELRL